MLNHDQIVEQFGWANTMQIESRTHDNNTERIPSLRPSFM